MQTEITYDTVFDAQQHFRLLLDSMSRPGKINKFPEIDIFPPTGLSQAAALTGFALLNTDTNFFIAGSNQTDIAEYLLVNTGAKHAELPLAEYIFIPEGYYDSNLGETQMGTATYPEDSATLIVSVGHISYEAFENSTSLTLKGPGVNGETVAFVSEINTELLDFVLERNGEYPLGSDLIITDSSNNILCVPRSNKFTYTKTK